MFASETYSSLKLMGERVGAQLAFALHNGNGGAPSQGCAESFRLREPGTGRA
jgi:hypothetical protein